MNKSNSKFILPIIFIILVGAIVGFAIYSALSSKSVNVIVPKIDLKMGTVISKENTTEKNIAERDFIVGQNISASDWDSIVGSEVIFPLNANEPIAKNRITKNGQGEPIIENMDNPTQDFAVQIPVDNTTAPSNLSIGDRVTLTVTNTNTDGSTTVLGESLKVIEVQSDSSNNVQSITVEVTPDLLVPVQHALANGKVNIALVAGDHVNSQVNK